MPEGDTIKRLSTRLSRALVGRRVTALRSHAIADEIANGLVGHAIVGVDSRGKNLFIRFDDERSIHIHLRMLGRVRIESSTRVATKAAYYAKQRARARGVVRPTVAPSSAHVNAQLVLEVPGVIVIGARIPVLRLLARGDDRRAPDLASLGPDLLGPSVDEDEALRRFETFRTRQVGDALLSQRVMAGVGNVFKSEILFIERIDPRTLVGELRRDQLRAIIGRARELLAANIGSGPRRTRKGNGPRLWVYRRGGEPCLACQTAIVRILQGAAPGRSTYYCPTCQR